MLTLDTARCFQAMVPMRDGVALNTFVFLPLGGGPTYPVILQRTPYGITTPQGVDVTDPTKGWLPAPATPLNGPILRGWREIVARGYAVVYQDCRGRYGSQGEDRVYHDDAEDGFDTLDWIAGRPWSNQRVGLSGSSAAATTALAAASQRHPTVRAFFTQVGGSSIYDDVVYEGQSIEMERLWLWVANNIPGLSASHREAAARRAGLDAEAMDASALRARERYQALDQARHGRPPYVDSPDWLHLPLTGYPDFSVWQPFLDEIITHPAPDDFRTRHNFRATIDVPGFHVTSWFDIFLTSVIAAFQDIQARVGNQKLWIGPNAHYFVYDTKFWARDPYFEWFDHWLKGESTAIMAEPPVFYSPRAWVAQTDDYVADDWRHSPHWPPPQTARQDWHLAADATLSNQPILGGAGQTRSFRYDPRRPIPSLGGRNMLITAGARDQRSVQTMADYGLTYHSEPLVEELTLAGPVTATLHVETDCRDTDFVVKLIDVHPDGTAMLLMDGVVRLMYRNGGVEPQRATPGEIIGVALHLGDIHHTVAVGHRLGVDVTSSNFPRRIRNTNSGNPVLAADGEADIRVAHNVVHHGAERPSFVSLMVATG